MPENKNPESGSNGEVYQPSPEFAAGEKMKTWANQDMQSFWAERAGELEWYQPWNQVLDDSNKPFTNGLQAAR